MIRGIRGATTVEENTEAAILQATKEMMENVISLNQIEPENVASVFATVTGDLNAGFPAMAIRSTSGWELVPVMCSTEIPVPGSISKCIRVMIHVNTDLSQKEIKHVYMQRAVKLRPDLVK